MAIATAHLRVARPTDNIEALLPFYTDGLGFKVLARFNGHQGFDGIMLGHAGLGYHLEFTSKTGHAVEKAPTEDNLLIFYLPDDAAFTAAVAQMRSNGFQPVTSFNPYWDAKGSTFEDADGYRVVLANMEVPVPV